MNRVRLCLLLSLGLLAAIPPAAAVEIDRWYVSCTTDAMTDERRCRVIFMTEPTGPAGIMVIAAGMDAQTGEWVMVHGSENQCYDHPSMVRVDGNAAMALLYLDGAYTASTADSTEMVSQFKAGSRALIRYHIWPRCSRQDITISLSGFTRMWSKMLAASR